MEMDFIARWGASDGDQPSPPVRVCKKAERSSVLDGDAHVAGGAFDDPHGGFNAAAVEVRKLGVGNLLELSPGDGTNAALGGFAGTLLNTSCLNDQHGSGRGLGDEGEAAVFKDRDLHRNHITGFVLRPSVVLLQNIMMFTPC